MHGISGTNETVFGNSQGTAAQATNRPQSGHHKGRQVSESRESPAVALRHRRETAGGGDRAGENPGIRSRHATAVPSSTGRSGTTPTPRSSQEPEYENVPTQTRPDVATRRASHEAAAPEQRTGHPISRPLRPSSIALQPSAQPRRPLPTPRTASLTPDSPPLPERTYANLGGATGPAVEEPYMEMAEGVTRKSQQPSLPPTVPEHTYLNVGTEASRQAREIHDDVAGGAGPSGPRARALPPVPGRPQGNPGAAAEAEEEAIYDEIDAPPATSPQQPVQWRRRPFARKMGGAAASDGLQPDQSLTSHKSDPVRAYQRLALTYLQAVGIEDPELELVRLYRRHIPGETPFDRQVRLDADNAIWRRRKSTPICRPSLKLRPETAMFFDDLSRHVDVDEDRQYLGGRIYRRYEAQEKPFVGPTAAGISAEFRQPTGRDPRKGFPGRVEIRSVARIGNGTGSTAAAGRCDPSVKRNFEQSSLAWNNIQLIDFNRYSI